MSKIEFKKFKKMYLNILILFVQLINSNCQKNEKPIIEDLFISSKLVENKKYSITCQVSSGTVEWLLNGQKVISDNNISIGQLDDSSILTIKSMSSSYNGEFSCLVKNKFGIDKKSVLVKLNGKY